MEELLYAIPGLNVDQALDEVFEDEIDDYIDALSSFVKNAPATIAKLRNVTEENLPDYVINIHGLKSMSGWIAAEEITEKAENLESLAKDGDLIKVKELNELFLQKTEELLRALTVALEHI